MTCRPTYMHNRMRGPTAVPIRWYDGAYPSPSHPLSCTLAASSASKAHCFSGWLASKLKCIWAIMGGNRAHVETLLLDPEDRQPEVGAAKPGSMQFKRQCRCMKGLQQLSRPPGITSLGGQVRCTRGVTTVRLCRVSHMVMSRPAPARSPCGAGCPWQPSC